MTDTNLCITCRFRATKNNDNYCMIAADNPVILTSPHTSCLTYELADTPALSVDDYQLRYGKIHY